MQTAKGRLIEDLGDRLIIRHITPDDLDELTEFNAVMHADPGVERDDGIGIWTRDMILRPPPTFTIDDFTVVEDTRTGRIVSSLNLIPQTWSYGGVPFGVGQVEAVATDPDYRRRGLVRKQFDVAHRWSTERGQLVQVVSGIPWYYRQFGYEMCVSHGGGRTGFIPLMPPMRQDTIEPFRLRPATVEDATFLRRVSEHGAGRYLLNCVRDEAEWRYEIEGHSEGSFARYAIQVIERPDGEPAGYLAHVPRLMQWAMTVHAYELAPGVSWLAATPSVLRGVAAIGREYAERSGGQFQGVRFGLETEHPAYQAIPSRLPLRGRIGTWFIRVPDLTAFLLHVAPVLARRLAASAAVGFSGELKLNFYRAGMRLVFADGELTAVEPWDDPDFRSASASFPDLTFLQLLFGYRTLEELEYAFSDCTAPNEQGRVLLNILFPKQASLVWQVS